MGMFNGSKEHRETNAILERIASALEETIEMHKQAQNVDIGSKFEEILGAMTKANPMFEVLTRGKLPGGG